MKVDDRDRLCYRMISHLDEQLRLVSEGVTDEITICWMRCAPQCPFLSFSGDGECPFLTNQNIRYLEYKVGFALWEKDTFKAMVYLNLLKDEIIKWFENL